MQRSRGVTLRRMFKNFQTWVVKRSFPPSPGAATPSGRGSHHYRGFTITFRHITVGRTPLAEWLARWDKLLPDLTHTHTHTHNTLTKGWHACNPVGFEPTIPASERPQNGCQIIVLFKLVFMLQNRKKKCQRLCSFISYFLNFWNFSHWSAWVFNSWPQTVLHLKKNLFSSVLQIKSFTRSPTNLQTPRIPTF
jgi:hypothetical protein